jgi:hypothetical protein
MDYAMVAALLSLLVFAVVVIWLMVVIAIALGEGGRD